MIHYHGTPVGGTRVDVARFLMGRHAFVSFARPEDLPIVLEATQSFALDNGAFALWNKGGDVDVIDYATWVATVARHPGFDWCLIPDKIGGTEDENRALLDRSLPMLPPHRSVPVWHLHESLDWLAQLCDRFPRVALGSSGQWATPGSAGWWRRMSDVMRVVCDDQGRPRTHLHGLRMLDPDIFTRIPFASADSTNAAMNSGSLSRFGSYLPPTASQRAEVIAERIEAHNSPPIWRVPEQHAFDLAPPETC